MFRSAAITGASGGIGAALAVACAAPGVALFLAGRDLVRLEAVAQRCRARGAEVAVRAFDVTDRASALAWIDDADRRVPLDLVIANAGVTGGLGPHGEPEALDQVHHVLAVNLGGVVNTVVPAIDRMLLRGRGRLVLIGSLAGLRGLPSCPAYSASKAAVHAYGQALRGWLKPRGIGVTVVCPGYVATAMSSRVVGAKPFLMSADAAARRIVRAVSADRPMVAFPWLLAFGIRLLALLPDPVARWFLGFFGFSVISGVTNAR